MITSSEIEALFNINYHVLRYSFKDITDELALIQPKPAGNSINWVLGHILYERDVISTLIGQEGLLSSDQSTPYQRGSTSYEIDKLMSFSNMQSILNRTPARFKAGFESLTVEKLAVVDENEKTLSYQLTFLQFHEAYHIGQIGLLRRLVGLEGVIK